MQPHEQKSVEEFAAIAKAFCEWAESEPADAEVDVKRVRELLAELYLKAMKLPDVSTEDIEIPRLENSEVAPIYQRFSKLPVGYYWECFNPLVTPAEEPTAGMLNDDLGGIYSDLKHGFRCLESGHKDEAVWQWNFGFRHHWGRHLVSALKALHCYAEENYLWGK